MLTGHGYRYSAFQTHKAEAEMAKVLIVDDEPHIRRLLAEFLSDGGYEVFEAEDGLSCVDKAHQHRPDVILLDVLMPVMNGLQALKDLRENPATSKIPVILMTAFSQIDSELSELSEALRDVIYLAKPWTLGAVEQAIENGLRMAERQS